MRIGELAQRTGVTRRALRYYEAHGLLSSRRASNGYRDYDEQAVLLVHNIRRLLSVGFTAEEITSFLPCLYTEISELCPASARAVAHKLATVQAAIDNLSITRDTLAALLDTTTGKTTAPPPRTHA